jgi:nucleoside phosphorylase
VTAAAAAAGQHSDHHERDPEAHARSLPVTVGAVIMVVAATELEAALVEPGRARVVVCGIGPVEAALATTRALAVETPEAVLQIGIAGARTLPNASIAVGTEAVYCDVIDPAARIPRVERVTPDARLLAAARRALPDAHALAIGTTGRVGGAAAVAGVPALELRAVSNAVEETDRGAWRIDEALEALRAALPPVLAELERA